MQPSDPANEKTVKSPLTGKAYTIRRIGWLRRTRLAKQFGNDAGGLVEYMAELMKACTVEPKITDADLDNPALSLDFDWLFAEIIRFHLEPATAPTGRVTLA